MLHLGILLLLLLLIATFLSNRQLGQELRETNQQVQEAVQKLDAARRENEELMESVKIRRSSLGKAQTTLNGHKSMLQTMRQAKQQLSAQANAPLGEGFAASSAATQQPQQEVRSTSRPDAYGMASHNAPAASPAAPGDSSSDDDDSSEERERQAISAAAQLRAQAPSTDDTPFETVGGSTAPPPPLPSRRR